ncbi:MAG: putative DNA binding domain-containing protein [Flammeovirgaceae bacterium]|nr:putative DNA binding domain-containing protein [Flammeovirgaceae bacterium]
MKYNQLIKIIAKGESQTLDFKRTISHKNKIAKTLVAFANTRGGKLLVGVTDDKHILGVDPEEEKFSLDEAASFLCKPPIQLEYFEIENREKKVILIVKVSSSDEKPHSALDTNGNWNVYVRANDKSILAGKQTIKNMDGVDSDIIPLHLTPNEKKLYSYLKDKERITVKQFSKLVNISERRAKRNLVELATKGFLFLHDFQKEDFYSLA